MASTRASKTPAGAATTSTTTRRDKHGHVMDARYYFRQYCGLVCTLCSFASIVLAAHVRNEAGQSADLKPFIWGAVGFGLVGALLHELRPYQSKTTMTFDKAAVEARKAEIAAGAKESESKKAK